MPAVLGSALEKPLSDGHIEEISRPTAMAGARRGFRTTDRDV